MIKETSAASLIHSIYEEAPFPRLKENGIELPPHEIPAIAEAYRLGLAAAALNHIKTEEAAEQASNT